MSVEILKEGIKRPAQNNLSWVFPVRVNGMGPMEWKVDSFDLAMWFKEAVGRFPHQESGDKQEQRDILENWEKLEPRLQKEALREAELPAQIGIDGTRTGSAEWSSVRKMPIEELPPLSDAQRTRARQLGLSEEAYTRKTLAEELTTKRLLAKIEMFARLLNQKVTALNPKATVSDVVLRTLQGKFDVDVRVNGSIIPLTINEDVVDDLFESGSAEAEARLQRILGLTIGNLPVSQ